MKSLNNKVALVTSATRGIGLACALKLAQNGAKVYMGARRLDAAQEICDNHADEGLIMAPVFFDAFNKDSYKTMVDEVKAVKDNANIVKENGIPQVPMLLFISNGSGGTGFTKERWRSIPKEYISGHDNASYIELDCPHYVHDYEYEAISKGIRTFIK